MGSELAVPTPIRRFRGELVWLDIRGLVNRGRRDLLGRKIRLRRPYEVKIRRAIRRPGCLALEFERDGRQYDVTLQEGPDAVFRGPWQAKWDAGRKPAQESGRADCRLKPPGTVWTKVCHADGIDFVGTWREDDADWCWTGQLIPVEALEDPE